MTKWLKLWKINKNDLSLQIAAYFVSDAAFFLAAYTVQCVQCTVTYLNKFLLL